MNVVIQNDLLERSRTVFAVTGWVIESLPAAAWQRMVAAQREKGVRHFIIGADAFPRAFFEALAPGSLIARYGIGYGNVPIDVCRERKIIVANTPGVLARSVAEHAMGLILDCARNVSAHAAEVRAGAWSITTADFRTGRTPAEWRINRKDLRFNTTTVKIKKNVNEPVIKTV